MEISITPRQHQFITADADEVLFGGAAGGGKSYGQLVDAFLYALKYPGSKQLMLRRTFPELERSLIRTSLELYPQEICKHNSSSHTTYFANGSVLDFGYCDNEKDIYKYQSAEYDVIRFDELTHFTESMYIYLLSRLRGANPFPKSMRSSTNPGGVGHAWVKRRFIDIGEWNAKHDFREGSRIFIPSRIDDNHFLTTYDPDYKKRLENLDEKNRLALLEGVWDIFDGQYFNEFTRELHVIKPFEIPSHWKVYFTMDYGLDMLAGLYIAVDEQRRAYVIDEIYEQGLIISDAADRIKQKNIPVQRYYAPPDLWARRQETGRSVAMWFAEKGIPLTKTNNSRVAGWYAVHEWLKPHIGETGEQTADLKIFSRCTNLIRTLPELQIDDKNPDDVSNEPHELTHAPDALRGFCIMMPPASKALDKKPIYNFEFEKPKPSALGQGGKINVV